MILFSIFLKKREQSLNLKILKQSARVDGMINFNDELFQITFFVVAARKFDIIFQQLKVSKVDARRWKLYVEQPAGQHDVFTNEIFHDKRILTMKQILAPFENADENSLDLKIVTARR